MFVIKGESGSGRRRENERGETAKSRRKPRGVARLKFYFPSCHSAAGPRQGGSQPGERRRPPHHGCRSDPPPANRLGRPSPHTRPPCPASPDMSIRSRKSSPDHRIQLHVHPRAPSLTRLPTNCSLRRRELAGVELEQFISRLSSLSQKRIGSRPVSGGTVAPSMGTHAHTHTTQR